jgi:diguanylate cyclase (GGDEF)-like protein
VTGGPVRADQPPGGPARAFMNESVDPQDVNGAPDIAKVLDVQTRAPRTQSFADADQTASDSDQTASDRDHTAAADDQAASDSDQAASNSDQEASDRDLRRGGDPAEHDATRDLRDQNTEQRQHTASARIETAATRDADAQDRDLAASLRDEAAARQDGEIPPQDAALEDPSLQDAELVQRPAEDFRRSGGADRAAAARGRARAAADRAQAAHDREEAANDRTRAQADREALLGQVVVAETDALTGARTRGPGLADVDKEIERARRAAGLLVIAYVDLVGLKAINDTKGHAVGDVMLQQAVGAIRSQLRSYDLIVRVGGDEFLCVMSGATIEEARRRFESVNTALAADCPACEIEVGFSVLMPGDSAAQLIQRADAELPMRRR